MATAQLTLTDLIKDPRLLLAFGFGSGLSPKAPGTFGTIAALPFVFWLQASPLYVYALVLLIGFAVGIYLCEHASKVMGVHDHGGIVWDEFIGLWLTMLAVPQGWPWLLAGFVLFRIFDIAKPWPIGWLDKKVSGGFGIMIDDVLAGVYAWLILQLAAFYLV
ncbi:phosphatidylglycerophosphatase A family protein [Pseudoteredinibacter isoporae]|uniref:Phosphatidylglycerophosphatase A n=1 Tax=Pseudoteredinibacter isoporae TaxID=570281 RepID=A0A7X0MUN2_9GAMM|nr:phosphatidylglycerophosphatase A [Pseudoteredinibacter isoporae]MBB6520831.1 phosphatidylglycerophosphatase A [Pseudoteredinibacter isoporae]NHO86397.1 phosphatidylglycerophosphatase A [Pseudoteredinibacter isoporae]NIB25151.1 phosphatidylglycerophosphatase A [Pseudoteredinibacter isoporae]